MVTPNLKIYGNGRPGVVVKRKVNSCSKDGKLEPKGCPFGRERLNADFPVVEFNASFDDEESQPQSLDSGVGPVARLVDLLEIPLFDSAGVVLYEDDNRVAFEFRPDLDLRSPFGAVSNAIGDKVLKKLDERYSPTRHGRQRFTLQNDLSLIQKSRQKSSYFDDHLIEVDFFRRRRSEEVVASG